jgi:uroporphyrinogen-III decarboxylase
VVVGVDIYNLEAEAYGAVVDEPEGNGIPAVTEHPAATVDAILALEPFGQAAGRIPMVLAAAQRLRAAHPGADVRVPVAGPFSVATNLVGFDSLLIAVCMEPDATRRALMHLVAGQAGFCRMVRSAGLGIAFFESAATPPLLSPDMFREVALPPLRALLTEASETMGVAVPCIMGGDTTPILSDLLSTGTRYVICPAPGETDQVAFMKVMREHPEVTVRINMAPEITARGEWSEVRAEVDRIAAVVAGRPNTCLGTGALPFETSPETVARIKEYAAGV